ncbi:unnamed protein product, partial [Effrenium voratum]
RSLEPSFVTFGALISACEKAAEWRQALQLLSTSRTGAALHVVSCNAAISACEKASKWPQALHLLQEIHLERLQGTVVSYSAAITACAKAKEGGRALDLFEQLQRTRLQANLIACNSAIAGCEWRRSLHLLRRAKAWLRATVATVDAALGVVGARPQAVPLLWEAEEAAIRSLRERN